MAKKSGVKISVNMIVSFALVLVLIIVLLYTNRSLFDIAEDPSKDIICQSAIGTSNSESLLLETDKCPYFETQADSEKELADIIVRCSKRLNNLDPIKVLRPGSKEHNDYTKNNKVFLYACAEVELKKNVNLLEYMSSTRYYQNNNYLSYLSSDAISGIEKCSILDVDQEYIESQEIEKGKYLIYGVYPSKLNVEEYYEKKAYEHSRIISDLGITLAGATLFGKGFKIVGGITMLAGMADYPVENIIREFYSEFTYGWKKTLAIPIKKIETIFKTLSPGTQYDISLDKVCSNVFVTTKDNIAEKYLFMRSSQSLIKTGNSTQLDEFKQGIIIVKDTDEVFNEENTLVYYPPKESDLNEK